MSNCNNSAISLNIKDENIIISKNSIETRKIKGVETRVVHAKGTHNPPDSCPCCGVINEKARYHQIWV